VKQKEKRTRGAVVHPFFRSVSLLSTDVAWHRYRLVTTTFIHRRVSVVVQDNARPICDSNWPGDVLQALDLICRIYVKINAFNRVIRLKLAATHFTTDNWSAATSVTMRPVPLGRYINDRLKDSLTTDCSTGPSKSNHIVAYTW